MMELRYCLNTINNEGVIVCKVVDEAVGSCSTPYIVTRSDCIVMRTGFGGGGWLLLYGPQFSSFTHSFSKLDPWPLWA